MYAVVVFALLTFVVADEKYTSKYDNVDIAAIVNNERLLMNYFNCLMEKGKCTPDGEELKTNLPDALATECSKCTEKHKQLTKKWIKYLIENKKDLFSQVEAKYDPDGKYRVKYEKELKEAGA